MISSSLAQISEWYTRPHEGSHPRPAQQIHAGGVQIPARSLRQVCEVIEGREQERFGDCRVEYILSY